MSREKREQAIALGRLGWPLRRIEQATGVRRETAGDYLRSAGIVVRSPGTWGPKSLSKAATLVTAGFSGSIQADTSKPAIEATTGFFAGPEPPGPVGRRSSCSIEAYREWIELELSSGSNATGILQDLVNGHTFASRLVMAGVDIRTVAQLMGHRTIQVTMRYAHLAPERNQGAVEKPVTP